MKSKKDITYVLLAIIIALIGLSYAAVPLYQLFCQKTGFGGTVQRFEWGDSKNGTAIHANRETKSTSVGQALGVPSLESNKIKLSNSHSISRDPIDQETKPQANPKEKKSSLLETEESLVEQPKFQILFNADTSDSMPIIFKPVQKELYVRPGQPALAFYLAENRTDQVLTGVSTYNITPLKLGSYFIKIQCFCFEEQRFNAGEIVELPVLFVVSPEILFELDEFDPCIITLSYTFFRTNN